MNTQNCETIDSLRVMLFDNELISFHEFDNMANGEIIKRVDLCLEILSRMIKYTNQFDENIKT